MTRCPAGMGRATPGLGTVLGEDTVMAAARWDTQAQPRDAGVIF